MIWNELSYCFVNSIEMPINIRLENNNNISNSIWKFNVVCLFYGCHRPFSVPLCIFACQNFQKIIANIDENMYWIRWHIKNRNSKLKYQWKDQERKYDDENDWLKLIYVHISPLHGLFITSYIHSFVRSFVHPCHCHCASWRAWDSERKPPRSIINCWLALCAHWKSASVHTIHWSIVSKSIEI